MSENRKFQLNIKFGAGYEAPLLNIEGDTAQEFEANVKFVTDSVEALVNATTLFQAAYNVAKPQDKPVEPPAQHNTQAPAYRQDGQGNSWSQQGSQQAPPAFVPEQPAQAAPAQGGLLPEQFCSHGKMQLRRQKDPNAQNQWAAYMCPTPKGTPGQCKAIDAKTGKSWA